MNNRDKLYTVSMITIVFAFVGGLLLPSPVQATGGAGQIAELVMGQLNDALTYLNEGDTQAASEEIQEAINELKDTYEADQEAK
jgi:Tfp pilus assembly protein PilF